MRDKRTHKYQESLPDSFVSISKLRIEGNYLNLIKRMYLEHKANAIPEDKR